jgi:glutaredoxin 3
MPLSILDTRQEDIATRARALGIPSLPAVAIDGKLAECCAGRGVDETTLRAAL